MNIDLSFITDNVLKYAQASLLTFRLGMIGIIISIILGILISFAVYFKVPVLKHICRFYIELSRNTPLLVQIFFLYFGLPKMGLKMSENTCAVIGIIFLGSSYMAEAVRSGIEAVPQSQRESAKALGLSKMQIMKYVIIPEAFSISMPSVSANIVFLLKETSVLGAISIMEVTNLTKDLIGMYYRTFEALFMMTAAYLVIVLPVSFLLSLFERRIKYAQFGD